MAVCGNAFRRKQHLRVFGAKAQALASAEQGDVRSARGQKVDVTIAGAAKGTVPFSLTRKSGQSPGIGEDPRFPSAGRWPPAIPRSSVTASRAGDTVPHTCKRDSPIFVDAKIGTVPGKASRNYRPTTDTRAIKDRPDCRATSWTLLEGGEMRLGQSYASNAISRADSRHSRRGSRLRRVSSRRWHGRFDG
jgi:hypothetical protein